jgi:hypothetical protein
MSLYACADFLSAMLAWACFIISGRAVKVSAWIMESSMILILVRNGDRAHSLDYFLLDFRPLPGHLSIVKAHHIDPTFFLSLAGVLIIFFTLLLDDQVDAVSDYVHSFFRLLLLHFSITATARMIILTLASRQLRAVKSPIPPLLSGAIKKHLNSTKK